MKKKTPNIINLFEGVHAFLSNFSPSEVEYGGMTFPTVEHAYQAAKTENVEQRKKIQSAKDAKTAKRLGKKVTLRPEWDRIKLDVMYALLKQKFRPDALGGFLKATGTAELIEGNWWKDTYWGVCNGVGENHLGKLLMKVRDELRSNNAE